MTLIELVIAIVIISVGLAGLLLSFSTVVKSSADPMIRKQLMSIASELMNEITLKPYTVSPNSAPLACARDTYNDLADFNGYSVNGICDIDGTAIPALADYSVSVSVTDTMLNGVSAKLISVQVTKGMESFQLLGWRTDWAS